MRKYIKSFDRNNSDFLQILTRFFRGRQAIRESVNLLIAKLDIASFD